MHGTPPDNLHEGDYIRVVICGHVEYGRFSRLIPDRNSLSFDTMEGERKTIPMRDIDRIDVTEA